MPGPSLGNITQGTVASGFEEVADEFERNFLERGELGAACAVYRRGQAIVDLWGGFRDPRIRAPWEQDTLVLVFSATKGLAAMALAVARARGLFSWEEKVATYWPEFAQHGKQHITVEQLLAHQAGLCVVDEILNAERIADADYMAALLARQRPVWEPGTRHGYHCWTIGWLENELISRVDPKQRTLGRFFQEEVAQPLGLEFYIGTPTNVPEERIAEIKGIGPIQALRSLRWSPPRFALMFPRPWSLSFRALMNPWPRSPTDIGRPPLRAVEIPSGNGIGQVRSVARAYDEFVSGGHRLRLDNPAMTLPSATPTQGSRDMVLQVDSAYSRGFMQPSSFFRFGSSSRAFGTYGVGGPSGYGDPDSQIGFAYASNKMGLNFWNDPRENALRRAVHACLCRGG